MNKDNDFNQSQKTTQTSTSCVNSTNKHLIAVFWLIALLLGALQAWFTRYQLGADGVSYLDIADAYFRGDWEMAINAYWSPLYSWLLGIGLLVLNPSPYNEFPAVHIINYIIFIFALGCFHFFILQLIHYQRSRQGDASENRGVTFPDWAWIVLGYSLFIQSSLNQVTISDVSPDMCVSGIVYLASGILLRMRSGSTNYLTFSLLGVVLGFGYLAKAVMFPLAFIFLALSVFSIGNLRKALPRTITAFIIFLLIAGPFIIAISNAKGRITFGDTGKYNYWLSVSNFHFNPDRHWDGTDPDSGTPKHPVRKIFDSPSVYEFGSPVGGTYPFWFDPSYWFDGLEVHFDFKKQLIAVKDSLKSFYQIIYPGYSVLIFGIIILYLMGRRRMLAVNDIADNWNLLIPAFIALAMYSIVSVVSRYVAPFLILFWLGMLSGIRLPDSEESRKLLGYVAIVIALIMIMITPRHLIKETNPLPHSQHQVAAALSKMGVLPGDRVASIGNSFSHFWARIARVQIIAEMPTVDVSNFWNTNSSVQSRVIETFSRTGAKAIVTGLMPRSHSPAGWEKIGDSGYFVYMLKKGATIEQD